MPIRDFAIQNLHATGMSYKNVAKKFGLSLQRVTVIVKRPAMLTLEAKLLVNKERARKWVANRRYDRLPDGFKPLPPPTKAENDAYHERRRHGQINQ